MTRPTMLTLIVSVAIAALACCGPAPTHGYSLVSRHPNGSENIYRTWGSEHECEITRRNRVYFHPEAEWRCERVAL